jgi:hypothetical protein
MNANDIKTKVLHYWRFTRKGYNFIATEAGKFKSDILVSNEKEIIECETKISRADLRNDFKKRKHTIYKEPSLWYQKWIPNKFYFAVPKNLVEYSLELVEGTNYGIIEVSDKCISKQKKEVYCLIVKPAGTIQPKFKEKLHRQIVMRCSSELIRLRIKTYI